MGLAERRVKQRIPLDPRNTNWTNDANKVGQKLLEKMGWKPGHGLGIHGNGLKEPLEMKMKHNSFGIGIHKIKDDLWTNTIQSYDSLLARLNENVIATAENVKSIRKNNTNSKKAHISDTTENNDRKKRSKHQGKRKKRQSDFNKAEPFLYTGQQNDSVTEQQKVKDEKGSFKHENHSLKKDRTKKSSKKSKLKADIISSDNKPKSERDSKRSKLSKDTEKTIQGSIGGIEHESILSVESNKIHDKSPNESSSQLIKAIQRLPHKNKLLKAKNVKSYSKESLNEIFGIRRNQCPFSVQVKEKGLESNNNSKDDDEPLLKTSNLSIDEYFKLKMQQMNK